jgi:hypothetical protein
VLLGLGLLLLITDRGILKNSDGPNGLSAPFQRGRAAIAPPDKTNLLEGSPATSHKPESVDGRLSDALQVQLNEAVKLYRNIREIPGFPNIGQSETTEADFQNWVRRTDRLLADEPELRAEFHYAPQPAPLEHLLNPMRSRYKKALEQKKSNLAGIIKDLRRAGR